MTFSDPFKFVQLNVWDGRLAFPLLAFLERERPAIFAVQEMPTSARDFGSDRLTTEQLMTKNLFGSVVQGGKFFCFGDEDWELHEHCAVFLRDGYAATAQHSMALDSTGSDRRPRPDYYALLHATVSLPDGGTVNVLTHHAPLVIGGRMGHALGDRNFKKIADYIAGITGPVILCGDFNLVKEASSFNALREIGLKNLNDIYGVTAGRNQFSWRPEECVSHIFVNDAVQVDDYHVAPDLLSDHGALVANMRVRKD